MTTGSLSRRLVVVIAAQAPLLSAAEPVCCRLFGFDATAMLGAEPVVCGKIVTGDRRVESDETSAEERRRATQCALDAQARERAFVYTYRLLVPPDVDVITQAVFGAHGERMLLKLGRFRGENVHTVEDCSALTVLPDGKLRGEGCHGGHY